VTVTLSCPGPTDTEFGLVAHIENKKLFNSFGRATSQSVARSAYRAMMAGRRRVVHGFLNWFMVFMGALTPRPVLLRLASALNRD
jgi:hypothetical protein